MLKRRKMESRDVEIVVAVEIGDVEREAKLKYSFSPGEPDSRDCPGCPDIAEFQSGYFIDNGDDDVETYIDVEEYEEEAIQRAYYEAEGEYDAAVDAAMLERKERRSSRY